MERRRAPREVVSRAARIILHDGGAMNCTIANISASGAKLLLPEALSELPRSIVLEDSNGARHPGVVVWRASKQVGLRFSEDTSVRANVFGRRQSSPQ